MNRISHALLLLLLSPAAQGAPSQQELDRAIQNGQWNEAAQLAYEITQQIPKAAEAKTKGAYALFQRNFPNAALLLLSKISAEEWKNVPGGKDRYAEVVELFQKKVPFNLLSIRLDSLDASDAPAFLLDEIRFVKGRDALERNEIEKARGVLESIQVRSRFFAPAQYLLGTLSVKEKKYPEAAAEFSKVFDPSVLMQSSELWQDLSAQISNNWGPNLKVLLDANLLEENTKVGELAVLALARLAYGNKDFLGALNEYSKIPPQSPYYGRSLLERVWTLLALNRHEDAQKLASSLILGESSFESLEAHVVRAIVLTDAGRTDEARKEIQAFVNAHGDVRGELSKYEMTQEFSALPPFLQNDLKQDMRIQALTNYQESLRTEIQALRAEDHRLFPSYLELAVQLDSWMAQSRAIVGKFTREHLAKRRQDLQRVYIQARLIAVETLLEDREKLRNEFRALPEITDAKLLEHDERLVELLQKAVSEAQEVQKIAGNRDARVKFRLSELLWELGSANAVLAQAQKDEARAERAEDFRRQALQIAQAVIKEFPKFELRPQAIFFTGFAFLDLGKTKAGIEALEGYVKTYPQHAHVPDAYRILADLEFDKNNYKAAEILYRQILGFPSSPAVGYALYRVGWCAYNNMDFSRALLGLEKAFLWAEQSAHRSQLLSLQKESRHDLIALYAEVGDFRKAKEYFSQFLHEDNKPWLAELATELDRIGQYDKSAFVYKQIITMDEASKDNIIYHAAVIRGNHQLRHWAAAVDESQLLLSRFKAQLLPPQNSDSPAGSAEKALREAALTQYFEFQKRATPEVAQRVKQFFGLYLSAFQAWPSAEEPLYKFAHFLLGQKQTEEAGAHFYTHWTQFKGTLPEPLREESIRNLVFTLNQVEGTRKGGSVIPENAQRLLQLTEEYEIGYQKSKHTRTMSLLRPTIFFKYGKIEEGINSSQQLFDIDPNDEVGHQCFRNLRSAYYEKKDWLASYNWSTKLLERKNTKVYAKDLKTIREESLFLVADNTKDDKKAAEIFQQIARDPEMQRLKDKSLYNAFIRVQRDPEQRAQALQIADRLEMLAPKFEGIGQMAGIRAAIYQEVGDYEKALPMLERFLKQPNPDLDPAALLQAHRNAGLIAEAIGAMPAAAEHFKMLSPEEAKQRLDRLSARPASTPTFAPWIALLEEKRRFDIQPILEGQDLGDRIQKSTVRLENLAKKFLETASGANTPSFNALEAYCAVPLFYEAYSREVLGLAKGLATNPQEETELRTELAKVTDPIDMKAKELSAQCLNRSGEIDHDGSFYRQVLEHWTWFPEKAKNENALAMLDELERLQPWWDENSDTRSEAELLHYHMEKGGTEDSWFALAKRRWDDHKVGLSHLTLLDATTRWPKSGRLLNALGNMERNYERQGKAIWEKAAQADSPAASINLAIYYLHGAHLPQAQEALKQGARRLKGNEKLNNFVMEFIAQ